MRKETPGLKHQAWHDAQAQHRHCKTQSKLQGTARSWMRHLLLKRTYIHFMICHLQQSLDSPTIRSWRLDRLRGSIRDAFDIDRAGCIQSPRTRWMDFVQVLLSVPFREIIFSRPDRISAGNGSIIHRIPEPSVRQLEFNNNSNCSPRDLESTSINSQKQHNSPFFSRYRRRMASRVSVDAVCCWRLELPQQSCKWTRGPCFVCFLLVKCGD